MPLPSLTNVFRPARFQGRGRTRDYFEGYYLKVVDPERDIAFALIPGLSYDGAGEGHAFIQVMDGVRGQSAYERFDVGDLRAGPVAAFAKTRRDAFALEIGPHRFSESGMHVDVASVTCRLRFRSNVSWPYRPWSPGAMGPFGFVPGMQCKHGVVSLHHHVAGTVRLGDGPEVELSSRATGYIEKDWGSSFPLRWTWLQTNHLAGETAPACLMVSAGHVPWLTGAFDGHIAALLHRGRLEVFATYNGSRLTQAIAGGRLRLSFERGGLLRRARTWLHIDAPLPTATARLAAPAAEAGMAGHVNESLTASADVRYGRGADTLLDTTTAYTGLELGGAQGLPTQLPTQSPALPPYSPPPSRPPAT